VVDCSTCRRESPALRPCHHSFCRKPGSKYNTDLNAWLATMSGIFLALGLRSHNRDYMLLFTLGTLELDILPILPSAIYYIEDSMIPFQ
jgi:hypothetical protein